MTAPVFVNSTFLGAVSATLTPTLPASRSNGNLLLAICEIQGSGAARTVSVSGTGWVGPFDNISNSNLSTAVFYCIVNGSEGAPTFTVSGGSEWSCRIAQYSGVVSGYTPTVFSSLLSTTNSPITGTSITTTAADSLIAVLVGGDNSTDVLNAATNYTQDAAGAGNNHGTTGAYSQTKATSGTPSDSFSATTGAASSARFVVHEIEVRSANPVVSISSVIDQTLSKLTQAAAVTESEPSTIAQTLFAPTQALAAGVGDFMTIAQVLSGITQEFDAFSAPVGTWASTEAKDIFTGAGTVPVAPPTFVAAGTLTTHNASADLTLPYPSAEVNGDFYIAIVNLTNTGRTITTPAGWTLLQAFDTSNLHGGVYYRFGDGSGTAPVFNWTGGNTDGVGKIWQFHGVVTLGNFHWTAEAGNASTFSNTGIVTTAANSLAICLWDGNVSTVSGSPTGFTSRSNEASVAMFDKVVATLGGSASVTSQALSGLSRSQSFILELCSSLPPIFAAWASTEARDVWASLGSLIGGSWHSTEAKDLFAGTAFVPMFFSIGLTETPDHADFAVYVPPFGPWGSVETPDTMAVTGDPTPPLSVDAHATGGNHGSSSVGITSANVSITTTFKDDVIVLGIFTGGFWHQGAVTSISDTSGLFWQRRISRLVLANHSTVAPSVSDSWFEEWWAHKPLAGATTITVNTDPTGAIAIDAVAVAGANPNTPFDTHTGSGWLRDNLHGDIIDREGRGHFGNPALLVYSDSTKFMTLAFHASPDQQADTSVPPGFTFIGRSEADEGAGNTNYIASMYRVFNTQQFGTADTWFGPDASHITDRYLLLENIVAKDHAGTDDVIRWYFDGQGNRNIAQLGVGEDSITISMTTYRPNSIAMVAVMGLTNLNSRVGSITDDAGHLTWARRSIVANGSGAVALEVWWCKFDAAFDGNIVIHMDANTQPGDTLSVQCAAVAGADAFQRGEIWDSNGTLPHTNFGTTGFQSVGPFNTSNDRVLVMTWGANIDTTLNDVTLTNKNKLPFLFVQPPADLESDGPPSFHIGMEYKYSDPVVVGATAEFDISPAAQAWLMIADAMPVGPVSPPHGSLTVTEPPDRFTHNGDFTAIGIAPSQGWVGFPPNHAAMPAVEAKDKTTNSGAFTAIWDINGWIAFIPAFMALATAEADDAILERGWVLGPRSIIGHMHAGEAKDFLGFSGVHTFYTSPDSVGNRTSRITVTTNANLSAGVIENLVNGAKANGPSNAVTFGTTQPAPVFVTYDFGTPRLINEVIAWQNGPFAQPGLWNWRSSNDGLSWTLLTATPYTFDGNNIGSHVVGDISRNTGYYRFYQMIQTTNAGTSDIPQLWETEFKVAGFGAVMAATEAKDRLAGNMLAIPTGTPHPARKRRLLIVS